MGRAGEPGAFDVERGETGTHGPVATATRALHARGAESESWWAESKWMRSRLAPHGFITGSRVAPHQGRGSHEPFQRARVNRGRSRDGPVDAGPAREGRPGRESSWNSEACPPGSRADGHPREDESPVSMEAQCSTSDTWPCAPGQQAGGLLTSCTQAEAAPESRPCRARYLRREPGGGVSLASIIHIQGGPCARGGVVRGARPSGRARVARTEPRPLSRGLVMRA